MSKPLSQSPSRTRPSPAAGEAPFEQIRELLRGKPAEVYPAVLQGPAEGTPAARRPDLIDAALAILEGCELKKR